MPAVVTEKGLELIVDTFINYQFIDEKHRYQSGQTVYELDRAAETDAISEVVDSSGDSFVEGTDFDERDDDNDGIVDSIEWLGNSTPSDKESFFVSYTRYNNNQFAEKIAIGEGTGDVSVEDTMMQSEVNRIDVDAVFATGTGQRRAVVELNGGTEVPPGTDVSEFGLFDANGDMLYHETRDPITIGDGVRQDFFIDIDIDGIRVS
jgi:hypothetical protein